ncbi:hypothetical protein FACS18942_06860 [Planctomycetales bacterium]|nr:hypothetical protein FACS18942_06860 [Planctomycetales bacterium]
MKRFENVCYVLGIVISAMVVLSLSTNECTNNGLSGSVNCTSTAAAYPVCPGNSNCTQRHYLPYGNSKPLTERGYINGDQYKTCTDNGCVQVDKYFWDHTCTNVSE